MNVPQFFRSTNLGEATDFEVGGRLDSAFGAHVDLHRSVVRRSVAKFDRREARSSIHLELPRNLPLAAAPSETSGKPRTLPSPACPKSGPTAGAEGRRSWLASDEPPPCSRFLQGSGAETALSAPRRHCPDGRCPDSARTLRRRASDRERVIFGHLEARTEFERVGWPRRPLGRGAASRGERPPCVDLRAPVGRRVARPLWATKRRSVSMKG